MKKYLVLILGITIFACTQKQTGFKIEVEIEGAEGAILLEARGQSAWIPVDTAEIINGIAILEGEVETPGDYYLSVLGERAKALVFVENNKMTVVGKADSLNFVKVTGSATHNEYEVLNRAITRISEEYMEIYQEARAAGAAGDTAKSRVLMEQVNELYESTSVLQEDFVKNNPASWATPFLLTRIQYEKEVDELDALVSALDPKLDAVQTVKDLKERIDVLKKLAVGQIAPDFTQNDPNGNPVRFSDVYSQNEVTLLDFWAAWCGPCRAENPNVVAVFNDYKDKGFTVFGVSLDREKDAWLKAIQDDGLAWAQVSDLAYWSNAAAQLYAIQSIPSSLLVDKTGKIIAKNKRGEDLRDTVAGILD